MTNKITKLYHNGEEYYIDEWVDIWNKIGPNDLVTPQGKISNQKQAGDVSYVGFTPFYGVNENFLVYYAHFGSSSLDQSIDVATYNEDGTHKTEYHRDQQLFAGSHNKYYRGYGVWTEDYRSGYTMQGAIYYPIDNSVNYINVGTSHEDSGLSVDVGAVCGLGKFIFMVAALGTSYSDRSPALSIKRINTETGVIDTFSFGTDYSGTIHHWNFYETQDKIRVYGWKIWRTAAYAYSGGYYEIDKGTGDISTYNEMTQEQVDNILNTYVRGEYDNFTDWNLKINLESTTDGFAYFNGEQVGTGYFKRGWDNIKKEYCYKPSRL